METHEKIKLEDFIKNLESIKGQHTELVTVMIPAGFNINSVTRQLEAEKSTAANIKSKATRKNVTDALERIIRHLKLTDKTPPNGLALFSGNTSDNEATTNMELFILEPPKPLNIRMYRCDKEFVLDPLREILEITEVYGLLVIDRKEATIGLLEGKQIKVLRHLTSGVPSKIKAGGQCLSPDKTIIQLKDKTKILGSVEVGDEIKAYDTKTNKIVITKCVNIWKKKKKNYLNILIGDCWNIICSKEHLFLKEDSDNKIIEVPATELSKGDYLLSHADGKLTEMKIINIERMTEEIELIDIETETGNFFANGILVHNSSQRFHRVTEGMAKDFFRRIAENMKEVFFALAESGKLKGILIGGPIPTKEEFLEQGQLVTKLRELVLGMKDLGYTDEHGLELLVEASDEILAEQEMVHENKIMERFFDTLGKKPEMAVYGLEPTKKALEYGAVETLIISKKLDKKTAEEMEKKGESISSKIEYVSDENHDGQQFLNMTKGIAGILRFRIQ
ncbi:hypothetical protein COU61_04285 [Candidatus Pacearchaeota archaeon CG10_big_fil_rev_8_21_14_0_10_35_13]|nr:MAG: hypothetical protein COU61_04285 [Candidatus Pacearchaeota archaeon CG10_big_fil_rev_8_21_14_0_10_35_13]